MFEGMGVVKTKQLLLYFMVNLVVMPLAVYIC